MHMQLRFRMALITSLITPGQRSKAVSMHRSSRFSAIVLVATACFSGFLSVAKAVDSIPVPISYYSFNGTTGDTTVSDSIRGAAGLGTIYKSNGVWNAGTQSAGTFSTVDGHKAMHFDGSTWVRMPTATGAAQYSVSAWVKLEVSNQFASIVKNWGDVNTFQVGALSLGLGYNSPYAWSSQIGNTNDGYFVTEDPNTASTGQWYNVATTYSDVTKQLALYVNGTSVYTATANGTINNSIPWMSMGVKLNDSDNFNSPAVAYEGWLTGYLSDVTFWDVALTQGQITSINNGSPIPVPEPSTYALGLIASGVMAVIARRSKARAA